MVETLEQGMLVTHSTRAEWGIGKVVAVNAIEAYIYFASHPSNSPDDRVRRFAIPSNFLDLSAKQSHPDVDDLPPYKDGRFHIAKTTLTLQAARDRFLGYFPRGFADPEYWRKERDYKLAAHKRFKAQFEPHVAAWIRSGETAALRQALINVYVPADKNGSGLNLLSPQFEFPPFKESLEADGPFIAYVEAALAFAEQADPPKPVFERLADAIAKLPARKGGVPLEKWTVLTWLPFVADPVNHMFLKPAMTQAFASLMPFDLQYESHLNHRTYQRLQAMCRRLKQKISDQQLNPAGRELDMIDVHSFMWVVVEYGRPSNE